MTATHARPPLLRPRDVVLAGVAAALANHLRIPLPLIRAVLAGGTVVAILLGLAQALRLSGPNGAFAWSAFALLYLFLWALVPRQPATPDAPATRTVPVAVVLLGGATLLIGLLPVTWGFGTPLPFGAVEAAVLASGAVVWGAAADVRDPRWASSVPVVRAVAAGLLLLLAVILMGAAFIAGRPPVAVFAVVLALLGGAALVVPLVATRWAARSAERAAHARDEQRAEIAAHLHDSVLQTLAIIQNRAGAGSEVARIARAQERELRDWLFAGTDPFGADLATELRTFARELELEHAARIEVVTVGDVGAIESAALAGAAREALVNAARHAGGDVTVYAEATPEQVEVFVRDRGEGFEVDAVPAGRLGIRESIRGRMTRAGGSAVVSSGSDGTEVQLRLPRPVVGGGAS
ncbi:sensor histidine kinase [Homoserinibacter sp. GY 40078]|uniref:sensor histidine kinase n=1 Tax=Homoserinibacter sp. GY 40078 TaxID=2603275 RepID=UPI0011C8FD8C|nr:PspC domain-containing protein [Homoserinibacter sp. GY 40078]TXK18527.1 PspC domain-containing protein [Homoserinibacter sp. GY 40078]